MSAAPAPLVPLEVDLRDYPFMPLDVARLRDSDLVTDLDGDEFKAAVLLWCASWHQVPCASLPKDEKSLARFAGFGHTPGAIRDWRKVQKRALRGFVTCKDGRLYHPVVAEKALEGWEGRLRTRHKRECERIKKAAQRAKLEPIYPTFDEWNVHRLSRGTDHWSPEGQTPSVPGDSPPGVPGDKGQCPSNVPTAVPHVSLVFRRGEERGDSGEETVDSGEGKAVKEKAGGRTDRPPEVGASGLNGGSVGPSVGVNGFPEANSNGHGYTPEDVSARLMQVGIPYHRLERPKDRERIRAWVDAGCTPRMLEEAIAEASESKPPAELSTGYLDPIVTRVVEVAVSIAEAKKLIASTDHAAH